MKHNYSYGVKLLVINTCYPSYNWRKETRGHTIKPNRYNLVDPSVKINIKVLEQFLNYCWDCISKKSDHLFLSHPNLDCLDLKQILTKEIGDEVITYVPNRFLLLSDPNYEYIRKSEDIIPEYLVRDIKNFLVETNL
jgi:hypothetical protein